MAANFEYVTLPMDSLVYAQAISQEEAFKTIQESGLIIKTFYTFDFIIQQSGKESVLYIVYGDFEGEKQPLKGLQYVNFSHHNYVKVTIDHEDYDNYLRGKFNDELEMFLDKSKNKIDFSKIFGLIKKEDTHIEIYVQYR